jgi:hypothetical protein
MQSIFVINYKTFIFISCRRTWWAGRTWPCWVPRTMQGESSSTGGVVYTRWGRKHCPATSKTLEMYSGKNVLLRRKTLPNINITLRLGAMSFEILGLRDFCLVYPWCTSFEIKLDGASIVNYWVGKHGFISGRHVLAYWVYWIADE